MRLVTFGSLSVALSLAGGGLAQEPPTFKVDVNVVNVLATVRDQSGRIANGLSKDDFILEENGKPQEIRYFSRQTDLPLTVGLLVDTSMSQRRLIDRERRASYQFFEQVLRPEQDMAFVIKFDTEIELLQDLTNSRRLLETALHLLATPVARISPGVTRVHSLGQGWPGGQQWPQPWPGGQRRPGGQRPRAGAIGTALYDSVFLAADEVLRKQGGRKAIILISDGVDLGSKVTERRAIESAQRADAIIYGVRYYDSKAYPQMRGPAGRGADRDSVGAHALTELSNETGGRVFEVTDKLTLESIFSEIQEELRNQYSFGYTPSDPAGRHFRSIDLRTRDNKLKVRTRPGYYPKPA